jgi:hypothetical protein
LLKKKEKIYNNFFFQRFQTIAKGFKRGNVPEYSRIFYFRGIGSSELKLKYKIFHGHVVFESVPVVCNVRNSDKIPLKEFWTQKILFCFLENKIR